MVFVSQVMRDPTYEHLRIALRILSYLNAASGQGLHFKRHVNRDINVFTCADWARSKTDIRSTR